MKAPGCVTHFVTANGFHPRYMTLQAYTHVRNTEVMYVNHDQNNACIAKWRICSCDRKKIINDIAKVPHCCDFTSHEHRPLYKINLKGLLCLCSQFLKESSAYYSVRISNSATKNIIKHMLTFFISFEAF